jgi:hypothetical protein
MNKPTLFAGLASTAVLALLTPGSVHAASASPSVPADATHVYPMVAPSLGTVGGVSVDGSAYGSSLTPVPGDHDLFYGLTDRGPNVDGPDGTKVEPLPDFTPAIGELALVNGRARLVRKIQLRAADGTPYDGRVNLAAQTGETITDLGGHTLPASPYGYDPEGLVALPDGTFWVSDEYGPFITHFGANGRAIERLSPYDGSLPAELRNREPNKGMEGLTVTPDGKTLVGIMQAGLDTPDGPKSKNVPFTRIVTVNLHTHVTHEYLYLLHTTDDGVQTAVSEITALNNHRFVVDERDGNMEPGADKVLYEIDLHGATDVGPRSSVAGASYGTDHGLMVGGQTLEGLVGKASTADATATLVGAGIQPVSSTQFLDVSGLVTAIAPDGSYYGHDKVEGVALLDGGHTVVLSNDSDFGIDGLANDAPPFQLHEKLLPNGQQDHGELLVVDRRKVPAQFR